ncbi:hypothetical protein ZIOFF_041373 [Zingiber officinale]|uniref:protein-serine/threonine phosphatase n=1 Tax=Zingiber officinale TaxID=94328 RepID=A0A8J5L1L3_ZINOF|nr:hypothetical protein ZIOFF_041373 [Zingiber officinale]
MTNPKLGSLEFKNEICESMNAEIYRKLAYLAKRKALSLVEGSVEEEFGKSRNYCTELKRTDRDATIILKLTEDKVRLRYLKPPISESSKISQGGARVQKPPRHLSVIRHSTKHCPPWLRFGDSCFDISCARSGNCSEIGPKLRMEDEHICIDNLVSHLRASVNFPSPGAFYGVSFFRILLSDTEIKQLVFAADLAFANSPSLDRPSGTTAHAALIFGRSLLIANAGHCRAILLSRDHKPNCKTKQLRIEKLGGSVFDGYLNGQLSVARALGDWHMKGPKGSSNPLIAEN